MPCETAGTIIRLHVQSFKGPSSRSSLLRCVGGSGGRRSDHVCPEGRGERDHAGADPLAHPIPLVGPSRRARPRDARRPAGRGLHPGANGRPGPRARRAGRRVDSEGPARRHSAHVVGAGDLQVRPRHRERRAGRGLRRGFRRPEAGIEDRRRGSRVRGLRHRRAGVPMGRLQGRGPQGQGPPRHEQRPGGESERAGPLRGQDAALVRALGLQVPHGGAEGSRGRDHHPHDAVRGLRLAGHPDVLGGRAVRAARRRHAARLGEDVGDRGACEEDRRAGRQGPRLPPRLGGEAARSNPSPSG